VSTTDLEKQSLEAHVDLCAERYGQMKLELEQLQAGQTATNNRLDNLKHVIEKIDDKLQEKENQALRGIVRVAGSVIFTLLGALGGIAWYLLTI
jgi:hypothetical protein